MKHVQLKPMNKVVSLPTQENILQALLAEECDVPMACGGQGICATCHVYVREGMDKLSPMTKREEQTLSINTGSTAESRLACQACVQEEGVVIEVPEAIYPQSFAELKMLIGQRADVAIRHPRDGRILIDAGKIITKSKIMELQDVDFAVGEMS